MRKFITTVILCLGYSWVQAQNPTDTCQAGFLRTNSGYSYRMMEPTQNLRKVYQLAIERKNGELSNDQSLTIGASLIALASYQNSNRDTKFGYMMRHPTSRNQIGDEVTEAVLHSFQVGLTGTVNSWLAAYAELLYDPQQTFVSTNPTATTTNIDRNQIQLRKAYLFFGNLNKLRIYGAIGKMDTPFGQTGSVNAFTNSTTWHAFGGLAYGAQIGFTKWNLHLTAMAVQGGAQFRALNMPVGDNTNVPSKLNNFVADLNYTFHFKNNFLRIGSSYMLGSAYCQEFPVIHFEPGKDNNPAYVFYGKLNLDKRLNIQGNFARTVKVWPGTHNPAPPLDKFAASKVTAFDVGTSYQLNTNENNLFFLSGEFSKFIAGPDNAPWERQNQYVLGFSCLLKQSSKLFFEAFRTEGYVPLNLLSGSNDMQPFPAGTTHSEHDAHSMGLVLGGQLTF